MPENQTLEGLVRQYHEAGTAWIEAKLKADLLEEDQKPYLASLQNALDDGSKSEAKLDREARGSTQYRDFIKGMVLGKAESLRKKVRFDSISMLFSAKQSEMAMEREKISKGIYHEGR